MNATVIYVAYGVETIDLSWLPEQAPTIVVHNDQRFDRASVPSHVRHLGTGRNIGFGAAVNLALGSVETERVIVCNPDTRLERAHYDSLIDARPDELVTVPLVEESGVPNSVVNGYWGPLTFLATARRLGRFLPRGGRFRRLVAPLLGSWGRAHAGSLEPDAGEWPLTERWASGAVLSLPTDTMRRVGGFDEAFFLYYEDTDLQQRIARNEPDMRLRLASVRPAVHAVGGSEASAADAALDVASVRRNAARIYADRQPGVAWRIVGSLVGGRPIEVAA